MLTQACLSVFINTGGRTNKVSAMINRNIYRNSLRFFFIKLWNKGKNNPVFRTV